MNIIITIFVILQFIAIIGLILNHLFGVRNYKIFEFRNKILYDCNFWDTKNITNILNNIENSSMEWFFEILPNYDKMLYSFKKLKLENWIDRELINKLYEKNKLKNNFYN